VFGIQYTNLIATDVQATMDAMVNWDSYGFSLIPFSEEIVEVEEFPTDKVVIPLGGTKLIDLYLANKTPRNWHLFYAVPEAFDQRTYSQHLGEHLLNHDCEFKTLGAVLNEGIFWEDTFIKPTNDLKTFSGVVVPSGMSLADQLELMMHKELDMDETVLISPWKNLGREFRVVCVYDQFVDCSQYKNVNNVIEHARVSDPYTKKRLMSAWSKMHELWQPSNVYVIDFVEVNGGLKVVEYNCFNCSGLYKMDRALVYDEIVAGMIHDFGLDGPTVNWGICD
jgi:hypothetical protein